VRSLPLPGASSFARIPPHVWRFLVFYLALCCAIFTVLVYWPGYMSPDSVATYEQARYGVVSNIYPPLMAYIWRFTDRILPGPGGMLIIHNLVFWGALASIAQLATRIVTLRILFVLFAGFWPPTFCTLGTIWKDVGMQIFLLASVACLIALGKAKARPSLCLILMLVALFVAGGYRHNAIAAAPPLIVLAAVEFLRVVARQYPRFQAWVEGKMLKRLLFTLSVLIALSFVVAADDLVYTWGIPPGRLYVGAMLFDLAGISVYQNHDYMPAYTMARDKVTIEDLKRMYSPLHITSLGDPQVRPLLGVPNPLMSKALDSPTTDEQEAETVRQWWTVVLDNPGSYLHHRLQIAGRLLVLPPFKPWYPYISGIDDYASHLHLNLVFHPSRLNTWVMDLVRYSAFSTHIFAAWLYYLVLVACFMISFLWEFAYARLVQVLVASAYLYAVSIFFFSMSGDFRYNIWAITCSYLCVFLLMAGRGTQRLGSIPDSHSAISKG
jgi:hypothetical protein